MPYEVKYASFGSTDHPLGQGTDVTNKVKRLLGNNIVVPFPVPIITKKEKLGVKDPIQGTRKDLLIVLIDPNNGKTLTDRFEENVNEPWTIIINF